MTRKLKLKIIDHNHGPLQSGAHVATLPCIPSYMPEIIVGGKLAEQLVNEQLFTKAVEYGHIEVASKTEEMAKAVEIFEVICGTAIEPNDKPREVLYDRMGSYKSSSSKEWQTILDLVPLFLTGLGEDLSQNQIVNFQRRFGDTPFPLLSVRQFQQVIDQVTGAKNE